MMEARRSNYSIKQEKKTCKRKWLSRLEKDDMKRKKTHNAERDAVKRGREKVRAEWESILRGHGSKW